MGDKNYLPLHPQLAPLELRVFLFSAVSPVCSSEMLGSFNYLDSAIDFLNNILDASTETVPLKLLTIKAPNRQGNK